MSEPGKVGEACRVAYGPAIAIDWDKPHAKVSKHFTVAEVTNWGEDSRPTDAVFCKWQEFLSVLDKLRDAWGGPIGVFRWVPSVPAADIYAIGEDSLKFDAFLGSFGGTVELGGKTHGYSRVYLGPKMSLKLPADLPKRQTEIKSLPEAGSIYWDDPSAKVSKYFIVREVTQGDRRRIPDTLALEKTIVDAARELDKVREAFGSPIGVTSWNRPPVINRAVGGATYSTHIDGHGIDIYPMVLGTFDPALEQMLKKRWGGGIGLGASNLGFTHIDGRGGGWDWGNQSYLWYY